MMTLGVLFGILASFLWVITNHIDEFLLSDINKSRII